MNVRFDSSLLFFARRDIDLWNHQRLKRNTVIIIIIIICRCNDKFDGVFIIPALMYTHFLCSSQFLSSSYFLKHCCSIHNVIIFSVISLSISVFPTIRRTILISVVFNILSFWMIEDQFLRHNGYGSNRTLVEASILM